MGGCVFFGAVVSVCVEEDEEGLVRHSNTDTSRREKDRGGDRGQMLLSASKSHRANHLASRITTTKSGSGVECVCVCVSNVYPGMHLSDSQTQIECVCVSVLVLATY